MAPPFLALVCTFVTPQNVLFQGALRCIEQHPGHFQLNQCYIPYSETLRNSVKYPIKSVNDPCFYICLVYKYSKQLYILPLCQVCWPSIFRMIYLPHCLTRRTPCTDCILCRSVSYVSMRPIGRRNLITSDCCCWFSLLQRVFGKIRIYPREAFSSVGFITNDYSTVIDWSSFVYRVVLGIWLNPKMVGYLIQIQI